MSNGIFRPIPLVDPDAVKQTFQSWFNKSSKSSKKSMSYEEALRNGYIGWSTGNPGEPGYSSSRDYLLNRDSDPPSSAVEESNVPVGSYSASVVYPNAPYATMFGMSSDTAYQEALAGSAHQREVADLKAAGLNPVLGVSGSGASVFAGSAPSGIASSGNALIDIVGDLLTLGTGKRYIGTAAKSLGHSIETAVADGSLASVWNSAKTAMKNLF